VNSENFAGKLKTSLYWWLGFKKSFIVNDEYKIELLHIDREHQSVKIRITNLKTQKSSSTELTHE
jgi:hypothetical protein